MPVRKEKNSKGKERRYIAVAIAIPLALVCLVPSLIGLGLVLSAQGDIRHQANENTTRIREARVTRSIATAAARRADLISCRNSNKTSRALRSIVLSGPQKGIPILVALNFTQPQIAVYLTKATVIARQQAALIPLTGADAKHPRGNCAALPNPHLGPKPKPKP